MCICVYIYLHAQIYKHIYIYIFNWYTHTYIYMYIFTFLCNIHVIPNSSRYLLRVYMGMEFRAQRSLRKLLGAFGIVKATWKKKLMTSNIFGYALSIVVCILHFDQACWNSNPCLYIGHDLKGLRQEIVAPSHPQKDRKLNVVIIILAIFRGDLRHVYILPTFFRV